MRQLVLPCRLQPGHLKVLALLWALLSIPTVYYNGDDGVERSTDLGGSRASHLQPEADVLVALVHDYDHQGVLTGTVVHEGGDLEHVAAGTADDSPCARVDEAGKVREVPEGGLIEHPARPAVQDDGGHAVVPHVVRPAPLIQAEIPVDPALAPRVDVGDEVHRVALPELPVAQLGAQVDAGELLAALGEEYVLVGAQLGHAADVLEAGLAPDVLNGGPAALWDGEGHGGHVRPDLEAGIPIPVVSDAPYVLGSLRVTVYNRGSFQHAVAVVVPNKNLHRVHASCVQSRPKVIADKDHLVLCGPNTRLPRLQTLRLVLHAHAPNWNTVSLHLLDEADIMVRPRVPALLAQDPCVEFLDRPHPWNRTPGAGKQCQRRSSNVCRTQDHGNDRSPVVVDAEARQSLVVRGDVPARPSSYTEVAGAYRHTTQRIAQSRLAIEVSMQHLLLLLLGQRPKYYGRGLGKAPSEAQPRL
mmetsp:Transcript_125185/g.365600  ORF Transcript_125185/g.365600 Transcript_125185/m.365600 type:complete len:471 (+) Transcript_125185:583-1995(+)